MLQLSLSGSLPDFVRVLPYLQQLAAEIAAELPEPVHHVTKPLITAQPEQQAVAETKPRGGRKPKEVAAPGAGPFGAPQPTQQQQMPFAAPQGAGPFGSQTAASAMTASHSDGGVPTVEAVQDAISSLFGRGKGASVPGLLGSFGATKADNVPAEKRADFLAAAAMI